MFKLKTNSSHFLYTMLVALLFVGCKESNQESNQESKSVKAEKIYDYEVTNQGTQILVIDSCEYVWCKNGNGAGLTHKGNCKLCLARSTK
jgi:molybdenum cofactor biosynthesis enzyme MoaA